MNRLMGWAVLAGCVSAVAAAADARLDPLLHRIEERYNRAQTLTLGFTETYAAPRHVRQTESGILYLSKPARMKWDYTSPAGKIFLSDGKNVYLYSPGENRVEKSPLKQSEDMRAPLAFLLGKLNFYKEFRSFESRSEGPDTWIAAAPNSGNLSYSRVEFLVNPEGRIHHLRVTGQDQSILDFEFSQERINPPLNPALFAFRAPAGAQVEETR